MTEVTLRNGVWVHEIEWAAIQRVLNEVKDFVDGRSAGASKMLDAYWGWRNVEMDIENSTRAIRSLTNLISELTTEGDDVRVNSVL